MPGGSLCPGASPLPPTASHEAVRLSGAVGEGPLRTPAYLRNTLLSIALYPLSLSKFLATDS